MCAPPAELPGPGLGRADLPSVPAAAAALGPEEEDEEAEGRGVVPQKVPSEANPKVRNHGEGPY